MLSTDCLGTQELQAFCKTTEILEYSHPPEVTLDKTAVGSTLTNNQNGKFCTLPSFFYLPGDSFQCVLLQLISTFWLRMYMSHIIIAKI
jgi:hypothetical protein